MLDVFYSLNLEQHLTHPKLLVTYHRIYHMNIQDNRKNLAAEMAWRDEAILDEIREAGYEGYVVNGKMCIRDRSDVGERI